MRLLKIIITLLTSSFFFTSISNASELNHLHFLIPGGSGGGWDSTARGVGNALVDSKLLRTVSYENMSGTSGGKAMTYLVETANTQRQTLMINSTPIVIRSLQKIFPLSFKDLTPIGAVIADYQVLALKADSPLKNWEDVLAKFKSDARALKIGGGSIQGGMDHLVSAQIFKAAGQNPKKVNYISYDAGGNALNALLKGKVDILSTGFGEVIEFHRQGKVRIIAVAADTPIASAPHIPTFRSLGIHVNFANWRGFFGAPGLSDTHIHAMQELFKKLLATSQWESVRHKNGWSTLGIYGKEFEDFLQHQETSISSVMKEMGFL